MTFLVGDTQIERHAKIRGFLDNGEPVISVLLAAADFEWTIRRAIIALGNSPNAEIRTGVLERCSGLDRYKEAWRSEVKKRFKVTLPDVIKDWGKFKKAFELRHRLVHGVSGTTGQAYARERVEVILRGSAEIAAFAQAQSINLFDRLPVRHKKKK